MRKSCTDRGAAAVEFALLLPVLLLFVGGVADFGRYFFTQITVSHAAREGVRVWALGEPDKVSATVTSRAAGVAVTISPSSPTACTFGQPVTLKVSTSNPFTYITPGLASLLPTNPSSNGVMRCGG